MVEWHLRCEPREVQLRALDLAWPNGEPRKGWAHFMEMRLGKTYVALNEFCELRVRGLAYNMVVLAPNRYKWGWCNEIVKVMPSGRMHPVLVYESVNAGTYDPELYHIVIVHYEALNTDKGRKFLKEFITPRTLFVADESVLLKNPKAGFFKHAHKLSRPCRYRRLLTGLPAPQAAYDFWAQLQIIDATYMNFFAFKNKFTLMGGWMGRQATGYKNKDKLDALLEGCSFRAKRRDWVDTYDTDFEIGKLKMRPDQQKHYRDMEEEFMVWLESGEVITVSQAITKRMKMQQISSGFIIDEQRIARPFVDMLNTPKMKDLRDRLHNEIPGKCIVVCHYKYTVKAVTHALERLGHRVFVLAGQEQMNQLNRDPEVEKQRFNDEDSPAVMVVQVQAAKYGHNLMGNSDYPCLDMVFFENSYSLDSRSQVEQRPQGVGQKAPLHVLDYASSEVEIDIIEALQKKKNLSEAIMKVNHDHTP